MCLSQKGPAINSTPVKYVMQGGLVNINIPVLIVAPFTHSHHVIKQYSGPFEFLKGSNTEQRPQPSLRTNQKQNPQIPQKGPTPISPNKLSLFLHGYPKFELDYLVNGFKHGFKIGFQRQNFCDMFCNNLKSARQNPSIVTSKIRKEIDMERVMAPFSLKPFPIKHCSSLGLVEKKEPGEYRLIHHLSFPEGLSINDAIPEEELFVQYSSVNDAIDLIKKCGRGAFCAKTDIKSAFRLINLSQSEFKYLGFVWQNQFYFDCCLPFGLSSSCKIFERFSTALQWCAQTKLEIHNMTHVLDDFIIVESSQKTCNHNLALFLEMCKSLGVPIADEKTVEACQVITFLGIELDTINMEARLPDEKVQKCKIKISEFLTKSKVTLRELQSLIGLLNFACNVVIPGRPFLRRLINLTIGVSKPFYKVRLTKSAKLDLSVWLNFLKEFNGKCLFLPDEFVSSSTLKLYTDASGTNGYAAVFGNQWFCGQWDVNWANKNIAVLELYPIVIAVEIWSQLKKISSI
ncbi:hypothetical protein FSP39_003614 [Pinctada imbricata]|uniref:Reverse transcriptase domain-containing protein n=1 Tax=Pinctada imbricata TaxID=66713 RepID=A0AA88YM49_PINIB|nr:hypothetical protein FSP39_003614 [Pinctada imbricata]